VSAAPRIKPPKYATIKAIALGFPGAHEVVWRGWPWFNVGKKTFALFSHSEKSWIFKLPQHQQMMLFDARPETFRPMIAGRMIWSFVRVEDLDRAELRDLLEAAWRMVAPKKLQRSCSVNAANPKAYAKFLKRLDAPAQPNEKLRRTMRKPAPWEEP
jgi:hypothetical protein